MKVIPLFLWLLFPAALSLMIGFLGTPHLVVSYRFHDNGDRHNPLAHRHYIDCTYIGIHGAKRVPAFDARCPWVVLMRRQP